MGQQFSVMVNGFTSTLGRIKENEKQSKKKHSKTKLALTTFTSCYLFFVVSLHPSTFNHHQSPRNFFSWFAKKKDRRVEEFAKLKVPGSCGTKGNGIKVLNSLFVSFFAIHFVEILYHPSKLFYLILSKLLYSLFWRYLFRLFI